MTVNFDPKKFSANIKISNAWSKARIHCVVAPSVSRRYRHRENAEVVKLLYIFLTNKLLPTPKFVTNAGKLLISRRL